MLFSVLPGDVELNDPKFVNNDSRLSLHDGKRFKMNLSDSPRGGQVQCFHK